MVVAIVLTDVYSFSEYFQSTNHTVYRCRQKHGYPVNFTPKANQAFVETTDNSANTLSDINMFFVSRLFTSSIVFGTGVDASSSTTLTE